MPTSNVFIRYLAPGLISGKLVFLEFSFFPLETFILRAVLLSKVSVDAEFHALHVLKTKKYEKSFLKMSRGEKLVK